MRRAAQPRSGGYRHAIHSSIRWTRCHNDLHPATSWAWCARSCRKYRAKVSTVNTDPLDRRPGRSHWSARTAANAAAAEVAAPDSSPATTRGSCRQYCCSSASDVLIPVRERRVVLGEHELQALLEERADVTHVTPVLEGDHTPGSVAARRAGGPRRRGPRWRTRRCGSQRHRARPTSGRSRTPGTVA